MEWTHEDCSESMLDFLVNDNPTVRLTRQELNFIKDLIHGEPRSDYPQAKKGFLFEIVSNKRNSIDVDKFDYILRDCHNIGMKVAFDPNRLMHMARVIDNQICYNQKEALDLYQLFHSRYLLFKQVYTHKVSSGIELMVKDILLRADSVLKISTDVDDMSRYLYLNDTILSFIERSTSKELDQSRKILRRLRLRDLYKCADQVILPDELHGIVTKDDFSEQSIANLCDSKDIRKSDIIVEWLTLNYAMKDKDPMNSVGFYTKYDPNKLVINPNQRSN